DGISCLSVLHELAGDFPTGGAAGLSLGEITAYAAAGTFDFASGLKLVERRGELMDEACAATNGAMAAMIGADENVVRQLAADEDVDIANINAPGQIVISGERAKVEAAIGVAREYGIRRATLLNVAGAYHSRLMESAYERLGAALQHVMVQPPRFPVISNVTGEEVETPIEIRQTLQDQVTGTVRWMDCVERLVALGCDLFIELGPGGVLAGLLRRTRKDVDVMSVSDAESVRKLINTTTYRFDSDEPQHMHVIWAWARGLVQYRDVFDNHMPLFQIMFAPIFGVIGDRATILYWMRFILLPMYFVGAWCTYRVGESVFSRRAGIWAVILTGFYTKYHFSSFEFRTDNLWAPLWLLCVTVLISGALTVPRAVVAGLLLGFCFGISMKSALLLVSLLVGAAVALVLIGRKRLGQSWSHLARCAA